MKRLKIGLFQEARTRIFLVYTALMLSAVGLSIPIFRMLLFNEVDLSEYPDGGSGHMTPGDHMPGDHMPGDHMPGDHMPGDHMPDGHMSHHVITNNDAFLLAMGDGASIEIHVDDADKESWTQLASTADAGDTTLTFTDPTGWEVGDRIAIASTDFDMNQA
ncbi:MAG: hypothetical protein AAFZ80_04800, partial [Cyanobacteria bacterium P01_A01_bin.105]